MLLLLVPDTLGGQREEMVQAWRNVSEVYAVRDHSL